MDEIINDINLKISDAVKCLIGEITCKPFGLAKAVNIQDDNDYSIPAIIDKSGECFYVFTDDSNKLGWYHKIISRTYTTAKGFGDTNSDVQNDEMQIVIWGLSNQLCMSDEEIERKIIIPSIPAKAILIASNFDAKSVLTNEFRNFTYLNKPEEFIFSVRYKISTTFKRKCREIKC